MQIKWFELGHWDAELLINWLEKLLYTFAQTLVEQKQQFGKALWANHH